MEENFSYVQLLQALHYPDANSSVRHSVHPSNLFSPPILDLRPDFNSNENAECSSYSACQRMQNGNPEQFSETVVRPNAPESSFDFQDCERGSFLHPEHEYQSAVPQVVEDPNSDSYEASSSEIDDSDDDLTQYPDEVASGAEAAAADDFSFMLPLEESDADAVLPDVETDPPFEHEPEHAEDLPSEPSLDPTPPYYKKRIRHKKGAFLPASRESNSIGPIETALRSSSERKTEHIFEPKVGTSFDSVQEAYEFFNLYSWEKGFGISYGKNATNSRKYRTMQELICANEGNDKRTAHQSQRCGCRAVVRLLRTEDHGWYISKFVADHNHLFSESCGEKMQWNSHRRIDECAKNMIKHLRDNNVALGKVHSIMGSLHGNVKDLPFTKRSLRTLCQQLAKEQMDDDVKKTLQIFRNMRKEDPDFAYSVDVDKHNRIKTLIWTNHRSKMQYHCFGDVFTFDTTYCTNIYKMPFGLFVGVNNHFQSVIFAGVLMRHETIKSFTWVFNEFLALMGGKAPITILTDQAQAMIPAVEASMRNTTHLWCKWHVLRKAQESLGPIYSKSSPFRQEFHKVLNEMLTIDEFECAWEILISKFKLRKNPFMIRIFECRSKWAKPYSKGKFCARMMSTQRGESANHMLKTYIRGNSTMNNFVSKYNDLLFDRAMEEDAEEHKTKMVKKPIEKMWPIQNHAFKIYTRASFKLFTAELHKSYHYNVVHDNVSNNYQVNNAYSDLREPWVRVRFNVSVSRPSGLFECECGLFTHFGILCCHAIKVMTQLGVAKIPDRYILKRWTRDARDILPDNLRFLQKDNRAMKSHTFRDNLLYGTAMKAVKAGNRDPETFTEMMKHFQNGIKAVAGIVASKGEPTPEEEQPIYESSDNEWHRAHPSGYHSEPCLEINGKTLYSDDRIGAVRSNFDISKLKGPLIPKQSSGRKRFKRFLSPVEPKAKRKKKSSTTKPPVQRPFKQSSFCSVCKESGHKRNTCPANPEAGKSKRRKPCCSTCQLPGHKSNNCHFLSPNVDDFDINALNDQSGDE